MKVLVWNIGCFSFLKYFKYFHIRSGGVDIRHEYFQPKLNGGFVSEKIGQIKPDIVFLQEFHEEEDVDSIDILNTYPYKHLIPTWYHDHSILIASKYEFQVLPEGNFYRVACNGFNFMPIHLNSFSAKKRFIDALFLSKLAEGIKRLIVLGDTNIWQCGHWFVFKYDKKAYRGLVKSLNDISRSILSTTYLGFSLDKVFCSKDIKVQNVTSPKVRSHFMDHYPVYFDLE